MLGHKPVLKPFAKWALLASIASFALGATLEHQLNVLAPQAPPNELAEQRLSPSAEQWRAYVDAAPPYPANVEYLKKHALKLADAIQEDDLRLFARAATLRYVGDGLAARDAWLALDRQPDSFFSNTRELKPCVNRYVEETSFEFLSGHNVGEPWTNMAPVASDLVKRLRRDCAHDDESGSRPWVELARACEYDAYAAFYLGDKTKAFERFLEAAPLRQAHDRDFGLGSATLDHFNAATIADMRGLRKSDETLLLRCLAESQYDLTTALTNLRLGKLYLQTRRPSLALRHLELADDFFEKDAPETLICGAAGGTGLGDLSGPHDFNYSVHQLMRAPTYRDAAEYVIEKPTTDQVRQLLKQATQEARQKK